MRTGRARDLIQNDLAVREKIRNSELHVIPRAAHMSNLENPAEFNQHLLEFLEKLG